ncbi:hypothetical protein V8E36_004951 [Tilletia maclaganii]
MDAEAGAPLGSSSSAYSYADLSSRDYSDRYEDPRYSAPAYHPEVDVFDDDSGPVRQRSFRPHSAAAMAGSGNVFTAAQFEFSRSRSDPAALCI